MPGPGSPRAWPSSRQRRPGPSRRPERGSGGTREGPGARRRASLLTPADRSGFATSRGSGPRLAYPIGQPTGGDGDDERPARQRVAEVVHGADDEDDHRRDVQGRVGPHDLARYRVRVPQQLHDAGDGDEPDAEAKRGERPHLLVERERARGPGGLPQVDPQQLRDAGAEHRRQLLGEAPQVAREVAEREEQRAVTGHPPVGDEGEDADEHDARADVMDAVIEVDRQRALHVDDAADVLPDTRGQRDEESEREERVEQDRRRREAADRAIGATSDRSARREPPADEAVQHAEPDDRGKRAHEDEVVPELVAPGLDRSSLARDGHDDEGRGGGAREDDDHADETPHRGQAFPVAGLDSNVWKARSLSQVSFVEAGLSRHRRPASTFMIP